MLSLSTQIIHDYPAEMKMLLEKMRENMHEMTEHRVLQDMLYELGDIRAELIDFALKNCWSDIDNAQHERIKSIKDAIEGAFNPNVNPAMHPLNVSAGYRWQYGFVSTVIVNHWYAKNRSEINEAMWKICKLPVCALLRHLEIQSNESSSCKEDMAAIADSSCLQHFFSISLQSYLSSCNKKARHNMLQTFCESPHVRNVRTLDLATNALEVGATRLLSESLQQLLEIDLDENYIGHCSASEFAAEFSLSPRVQNLDLSRNGIRIEHIEAMASMPSLKNLKQLLLFSNELDSREAVAEILQHENSFLRNCKFYM